VSVLVVVISDLIEKHIATIKEAKNAKNGTIQYEL
jgi:hypothetical protein